jgi:hypothetical protein
MYIWKCDCGNSGFSSRTGILKGNEWPYESKRPVISENKKLGCKAVHSCHHRPPARQYCFCCIAKFVVSKEAPQGQERDPQDGIVSIQVNNLSTLCFVKI